MPTNIAKWIAVAAIALVSDAAADTTVPAPASPRCERESELAPFAQRIRASMELTASQTDAAARAEVHDAAVGLCRAEGASRASRRAFEEALSRYHDRLEQQNASARELREVERAARRGWSACVELRTRTMRLPVCRRGRGSEVASAAMGDSFPNLDGDGFWPDTSYFVPYVERVMLARGWLTGARFQQRWRLGAANQLVGEAKDGRGANRPLAIEPIEMEWVLDFQRSRDVFKDLISAETMTNEAAQAGLVPRVNALLADGATQVSFGEYPDGAAREPLYVNSRAVTAEMAYSAGLDDLNAALGAFNLFAIPRGKALVNDDLRVVVEIEEVGVYVRDSFDFEGPQALGRWKLPDEVELPDVVFGPNPDEPLPMARPDGWVAMTNLAYRTYRDRTGLGEDFLVYSDVKTVSVSYGFDYPAPPQFK